MAITTPRGRAQKALSEAQTQADAALQADQTALANAQAAYDYVLQVWV